MINPGFTQAAAAFARGDLATTESLCLRLIDSDPDAAAPWSLLAETALRRGRPDAAVVCAGKAVARDANDPIARLMQAKCLALVGRTLDARGAADTGVKLATGNAAALEGLGAVFSMLGQHARALGLFHAAARIAPNSPQLLYNLAAAERMLGLFDDAERHCDQAIRRDPQFHLAYSLRSDLRQQSPARNHIAELEGLVESGTCQPASEVLLRFALGKECDDIGDHARAFRHFAAGAALQRRGSRYRVADDIAAIDRIIAANGSVDASRGYDGDDPIFIVGLPRSGTTLIERMIASHSQIRSGGELGVFPAEMRRVGTGDPAVLGQAYAQAARQFEGLESGRFIDKFPDNALHCGAIHAALPRARIVALRRDPVDSCFALYRTHFTGKYPFSYDLEELADYYAAFDRLMAHWRAVLPTAVFTEIAYEDFVADPEGRSRAILEFLGLPWEQAVLNFHESRAASTTASAAQVRRPVYSSSVGKWRNYAAGLQPLLARLGRS
jgi:Flp pilus assembly protein TadD